MSEKTPYFFNAAGVALMSQLQLNTIDELRAAAHPVTRVIKNDVLDGYKQNVINALFRRGILVDAKRNGITIGAKFTKQPYQLLERNHREGTKAWAIKYGTPVETAPVEQPAPRRRRKVADTTQPAA